MHSRVYVAHKDMVLGNEIEAYALQLRLHVRVVNHGKLLAERPHGSRILAAPHLLEALGKQPREPQVWSSGLERIMLYVAVDDPHLVHILADASRKVRFGEHPAQVDKQFHGKRLIVSLQRCFESFAVHLYALRTPFRVNACGKCRVV